MAQMYSIGLVTSRSRVQNQFDGLLPFGNTLILITKSLGEILNPMVSYNQTHAS